MLGSSHVNKVLSSVVWSLAIEEFPVFLENVVLVLFTSLRASILLPSRGGGRILVLIMFIRVMASLFCYLYQMEFIVYRLVERMTRYE